jgi:hypothetical protein
MHFEFDFRESSTLARPKCEAAEADRSYFITFLLALLLLLLEAVAACCSCCIKLGQCHHVSSSLPIRPQACTRVAIHVHDMYISI